MKNMPRDSEISRQDFDSMFLWKVFWKLLKQENPLCFFLKVFFLGAVLIALILFIILVGDLAGARKKKRKRRARRVKTETHAR